MRANVPADGWTREMADIYASDEPLLWMRSPTSLSILNKGAFHLSIKYPKQDAALQAYIHHALEDVRVWMSLTRPHRQEPATSAYASAPCQQV